MIGDPLILGAGPAGCAAAITLARGGAQPLLVDRDAIPGDPLCGGFLSWCTVAQLRDLGVDCAQIGAHRVNRLRLFAGQRMAELALPQPACGLSRQALDTELRRVAALHGVRFAQDTISEISTGKVQGRSQAWEAESIFLATGKRDVRGAARPRTARDPAMGLRLRLPPSSATARMLDGAIELHLFPGGYAGIVLREGGWANVCLALRKSAFARGGNSRGGLLSELAAASPAFAARLGPDWRDATIGTVGAVPYGWIAQDTDAGLFRVGDQAAVIPSLAGEGIGIALASGSLAARRWLGGGAAAALAYQREMAQAARGPVRLARFAWELAEHPFGARVALSAAALVPRLIGAVADGTRIEPPLALAHQRAAA